MADVHPYALRSFDAEVQAQADLERLRAEVRAAEAERDRIRDEARREGLALARGDAAEILKSVVLAIDAARADLAAAIEPDLVRLSLAVASKIVKAEVEARPVAGENLRRAIELTASRRELKVLVNELDLKLIETLLPELRREFADVQHIALEASPTVARGGAIVHTREGSVDATIDGQLDEIARGLLG